jgi:hypothetical protein
VKSTPDQIAVHGSPSATVTCAFDGSTARSSAAGTVICTSAG